MTYGAEVDPVRQVRGAPAALPRPGALRRRARRGGAHLDRCSYCRKRYRFEEELRQFVRQAAVEEMPPDLKQKLAELRTSLF